MLSTDTKDSSQDRLRAVGIRPTRQRVALADLLFADGDKHVTAESLYALAHSAYPPPSLATVYNTLKQFAQVGLLREVATPGHTTYFDTNVSDHHHYYIEAEGRLVDIPESRLVIDGLPHAPFGKKVGRVDIIVHLVD
jgi:Fur family iron response transcriptional regulator